MTTKRLALLLALLGGVGGLRVAALPSERDAWIEARTAHFRIWSDAGEGHAREAGTNLEQLRAALAQIDPAMVEGDGRPTYMYLFKNRFAMAPYTLIYNGKPETVAGYFMTRPLANYLVMDGDVRGPAERVVYHEYLHHLLHGRFLRLPLWLDEGLAEYFSSFRAVDGEARFGLPIEEHIRWLRQNNLIPVRQLFAIDLQSKDYHEGVRQGVFYAESWALTHYLMLGGNPARRSQLHQLASLLQTGMPQESAFARAFGGDYEALDHDLRAYVGRSELAYERLTLKSAAETTAAAVTPLARADVLYRLGDLLLTVDPPRSSAAAGEHFRAALAADPRHALAVAGMGELQEEASQPREARLDYERAVALLAQAPATPPADAAFVHLLLGRLLVEEAHRTSGEGQAAANDAATRAAAELAQATGLAPAFGEAWELLGVSHLSMVPPSAAEAVTALETAHRLLPARPDVALNLALAFGAAGDRKHAETLLESARLQGASPSDLQRASESLLLADHAAAVKLANAGDAPGAAQILERIAAATHDDELRRTVLDQLELLHRSIARKAFVDAYNHAVELANRGDLQGASAQLHSLLDPPASPPPADLAGQAHQLLDQLAAAQRTRHP